MAFDAKVYRILVASPGDVGDDRKIIPQVISEWNDLRASQSKIVVLPVKWETHSAPILGDRPQGVINEQLVKDCDMLVGLFWTRIGTHTGVSESGTIEEIEQFISAGKPVMIYVSSRAIEPDKIDIEQYKQLKDFLKKIRTSGLIESYNNDQDLKEKFARQLAIHIHRIMSGVPVMPKQVISESSVKKVLKEGKIYLEDYKKNGRVTTVVVKGDTKKYKDQIKQAGGKWNPSLQGWIFPKNREVEIAELIKSFKL